MPPSGGRVENEPEPPTMGDHPEVEPSGFGTGPGPAHASLAASSGPAPAARRESPGTHLRRVRPSDRRELLALTRASRELHHPWISPPLTAHMFKVYYRRTQRDDHEGFVICLNDTDEIVGVINVNNVVKGAFRSASVGYYASQAHAGRGYMREGLMHVKRHAFRELGLHRIEANIQPDNTASIRLVRGCGFRREGLSPQFLYVNGAWRDHERWAAVDPRTGLT